MKRIAIIGAGMAGMTLASRLCDRAEVTVFEKSRGCGGRMATRRAGDFQFDHGAQYFTARSAEFRQFLTDRFDTDTLEDWQPRTVTLSAAEKSYTRLWFEPHWVGVPGMNGLAKALAQHLDVNLNARVSRLIRQEREWLVELEQGAQAGPFDWVISTAPAPQTGSLLPLNSQQQERLGLVTMLPCFSLMLGFQQPLGVTFQAARIKNSPLGWLAVDSHKPGRPGPACLLLQSTNQWAEEHLDLSSRRVEEILIEALTSILPDLPEPDHVDLHRWLYAATTEPLGEAFILDRQQQIAACGDWCLGGRVETAFTSANELAAALGELLQ